MTGLGWFGHHRFAPARARFLPRIALIPRIRREGIFRSTVYLTPPIEGRRFLTTKSTKSHEKMGQTFNASKSYAICGHPPEVYLENRMQVLDAIDHQLFSCYFVFFVVKNSFSGAMPIAAGIMVCPHSLSTSEGEFFSPPYSIRAINVIRGSDRTSQQVRAGRTGCDETPGSISTPLARACVGPVPSSARSWSRH